MGVPGAGPGTSLLLARVEEETLYLETLCLFHRVLVGSIVAYLSIYIACSSVWHSLCATRDLAAD